MSKFYRDRKGFFGSLLRNSGWYLILAATALVVIGIFALLFSGPGKGTEQVEAPKQPSSSTSDSDRPSDTAQTPPTSDNTAVEVVAPVEPGPVDDVAMIVPVQGRVGTGFSLTVPVFSETMKDWRVHQGIDYLTDEGAEVVAAADGTVEGVYVSELMGLTVEIRHADGVLSIYQSLSEEHVTLGQEVTRGDRIGTTGKSADCEVLSGNHLHFALLKDGVFLDPNDRFSS